MGYPPERPGAPSASGDTPHPAAAAAGGVRQHAAGLGQVPALPGRGRAHAGEHGRPPGGGHGELEIMVEGGANRVAGTFYLPYSNMHLSLSISAGAGGRPRHPHLWAALFECEYLTPCMMSQRAHLEKGLPNGTFFV